MDKPSPFAKPLPRDTGTLFADMTRAQKWIFVIKVIICVGTFGFAFPTVQSD